MNAPEIAGLTDLQLLGEGSNFTVWKARQASLDRDVEVRQVASDLTEAQVAHHMRLARLLAKLNHAALTQVLDVNPDARPPYILTDHADAPSLSDIIEKRGVFSAKEALQVAAGVAEALAYVNTQAPLVIRNLKPQNLCIDAAGNLKITDFSLAILAHDPVDGPAIDGDDLVGTPNFISPEHAAGSPDLDPRSDMYSLGMVLYYLVTRKVPFDVPDPFKTFELQREGRLPNPRETNPALPQSFVAFLARLTMKAPQHRYDSWGDALADVRKLLAGKAVSTRQTPPSARATIVLANTVVAGGAAPAAEPAAAPAKPRRRAHPFAWLLLLLWLAWLANCRLMNPLHLPDKLAPQISIPALDALADKLTAGQKPETESQTQEAESQKPEAPRQLQQIPPNPYARIREPKAPTTGDPLEDRARPAPTPPPAPAPSAPAASSDGPAAPAANPAASALAAAIGDLVRQGDLEAARAKCESLGTPEAKAAAALLARVPSPDEAVGAAILARQGQPVDITYMGKARTVTPVRLNGSVLIVKFADPNGLTREVPMAIAKIDASQRIEFLRSWAASPEQHAAAAIAALQAGDEAAFRRHAADAGPLAALLAPR